MEHLLLDLSINVTSMFRDPTFFAAFRTKVAPLLRTYPFVRIWNAGCSTGEETWSLAILLQEEGLLDRCRIYATDINEAVLGQARSGQFPLDKMQEFTENYLAAGGTRAFSEYYVAGYDAAQFDRSLIDNIVFAQHNLVSDGSFNEFHVIVCRNVMIYFDTVLQHRVHELFYESLARFGVLALGHKEAITFTPHEDDYEALDARRAHLPEDLVSDVELVVIGASWGGLHAVTVLLDNLPPTFECPVVLVQHRAPVPSTLSELLARHTRWRVTEAEDKEPIKPSSLYLAPPGYHLLVERGHLALSIDAPVAWSRPSIDVAFASASDAYTSALVGIVLTGANSDGAAGLAQVAHRGGLPIVQDPATAAEATMPRGGPRRWCPTPSSSRSRASPPSSPASAKATPGDRRRVALEPASVLLVDDRPDNLLALEAVLEPLELRTVRASSGEEALRALLRDDVRPHRARRADAGHRRLRDGTTHPGPRAHPRRPDRVPHRHQPRAGAPAPRLRRRRRRLRGEAVRPRAAAGQGARPRRALAAAPHRRSVRRSCSPSASRSATVPRRRSPGRPRSWPGPTPSSSASPAPRRRPSAIRC